MPSRRMRIKNFSRHTVASCMYYSGASRLWHALIARKGVRILTYHGIEMSAQNSYAVNLENFEEQMCYLKDNFHVIPIGEVFQYLKNEEKFQSDTLVLTFDDGFKGVYQKAYPILKNYELPATYFVITSKADGSYSKYMNWSEIRELSKDSLMNIGSHTVSHRSLSQLSKEDLRYEINVSKSTLEDRLGAAVDFFSYPYGTRLDFDERSIAEVTAAGYKMACLSLNGVNRHKTHPMKLYRTKIEWGDDLETFKKILWGGLDIWYLVDNYLPFLQKKGEVGFS